MKPTKRLTALLLTAALLMGVTTYGPAPNASAATQAQLEAQLDSLKDKEKEIKNELSAASSDLSASKRRKDLLIQQKALNRTYWQTGDEFSKLFASGQIEFGMMWSGQATTMKQEGEPIAFVVPEDGAIGWVDNWGIAAGSKNEELALAFINYMISKDVQYTWATKGGPAPANQEAAEAIDPDYAAACGMDEDSLNRLYFMAYQDDATKAEWSELWTEVKAS